MRIFIIILLINISIGIKAQDTKQKFKVDTIYNFGKDTLYTILFDLSKKELKSESVLETYPKTITIIAYPDNMSLSKEISNFRETVIDNVEKLGIDVSEFKEEDIQNGLKQKE